MLALKYLLIMCGLGMIFGAVCILTYDLYREMLYRRALETPGGAVSARLVTVRWRTSLALAMLAWGPLLVAFSIIVVPSGMAGVRVSQTSGTVPGTLYPGAHFVVPLVEDVALFDTRDQIFTTGVAEDGKSAAANVAAKSQLLDVQAKEGLTLGLAITVRYRLDAKRLDYIQGNLPRPVEKEIVPPTVASVWREIVPNYTVRDVFSAKREEVRQRAAGLITQKLAGDGIVVKAVMLRDIQLPPEYAQGLETLLLKEQENDRMGVETELKSKQVRIAELEAEATKVQQIKQAEGEAQVHVLRAKGEADAMQYTLPLKQKQIEQSRLEAQARKEATIQNAEAEAQAKVIDSKAEGERRKVLADAEADRIRVTAVADAERMKSEAAILKENPLLINKIVAERLSDKLQIMMVPADGKFFFTNDVLRGMNVANQSGQAEAR
ncbi:MAG TPA: SPFH domain-containing protein [Candidatus Aquilonibacter sp.]|jgi:regulator of protease activity HflC (stomatin/prohibitin superfamily)|nr:SPFH domain-containing protein [Candidatus Aquilonibacter sp.]